MEDSLRTRLKLMKSGHLQGPELVETITDISHSEFINSDEIRRLLVAYTRHTNPDVRSEVVRAFAFHGVVFDWDREPGATLLKALFDMTRDGDLDCRRAAVTGLGSLFKGTRNLLVGNLLAKVAENPKEEGQIRSFAYVAFLDLVGTPLSEQPNPLRLHLGTEELNLLRREMLSLQKA